MYTRISDAGFQQLKEAVASSAFHNSHERFDPPKCHPGTRVAVMEMIMDWICMAHNPGDNEPAQKLIMWLNGKAGAGKSAIAQSIAKACEAAGLLLASFFFSRTDTARNNGQALIPTIAYQISSVLPETRPHLEEIITRDPLIFRRSVKAQMASLIIKPMKDLTIISFPQLIIIDGLNECKDSTVQENILNVISNTLQEHRLPLIFLISSRPEPHITDIFNSFKSTGIQTTLELNNSFDPGVDIRLFLEDSFNKIKRTHSKRSTIPHPWPTPDILDTLVCKASGQFIYASLVKKYVSSARHPPVCRLNVILGLHPADDDVPFAELDALYMRIFEGLEDRGTASRLLTYLCLSTGFGDGNNTDVKFVSQFLGLEMHMLEVCIADLSSLLTITSTNDSQQLLSISHAALQDFIFQLLRSGRFHIDKPNGHAMMALQCLKNLTQYSSKHELDVNIDPSDVDTQCTYSANNLAFHCNLASMTENLMMQIRFKFSIHCIPDHLLFHFSRHYGPNFSDWMEDQRWEGSQDAYIRLRCEYQEILGCNSQKKFQHPKLSLWQQWLTYLRRKLYKTQPSPNAPKL